MKAIISWLEAFFQSLPLPFMEVWGRFGFLVGLAIAVCAYGGLRFRAGQRWLLTREQPAWNDKSFAVMAVTFVSIIATGYLGSFIVLVPGAQTMESLKDLSVFLCVTLFGYPALVAVPLAYGLSDVIEGVPPGYLLDWLLGYLINPACFWIAYRFIGDDPDFRRSRTWGRYLLFVVVFMLIEPALWGYICSGKFSSEISYGNITPALFFTTSITWLLGPVAMLVAYPLAKQWGMFRPKAGAALDRAGLSIRLFLLVPFALMALLMVASTAFIILRSAEADVQQLAGRLQAEAADNLNLRLDEKLRQTRFPDEAHEVSEISELLRGQSIAKLGRVFIIDRSGKLVASSLPISTNIADDLVARNAVQRLLAVTRGLTVIQESLEFRFTIVTAKPLAHENWLGQATLYQDDRGEHSHWILMTAMPESFYMKSVRIGSSRSAMLFALLLFGSLLIVATLATIVYAPIQRISSAAELLARGNLAQRAPRSRLVELDTLATSFNGMARQLQGSFERLRLAMKAANFAVWDWDIKRNLAVWDETMVQLYGYDIADQPAALESWIKSLVPEDAARVAEDVQAAIRGERPFDSEFRIRDPKGDTRYVRTVGTLVRDENDEPTRLVGLNYDITEQKLAEQELIKHRDQLEKMVGERTSALSLALAQAESATRAKSDFVANMSHEIRTPLNAISGMIQLALRTKLNAKQLDYLQKADIAAHTLLGIVNDILDFSKIEAGHLRLENRDFLLLDVINQARTLVEEKAQEKGLSLRHSLDPSLPDTFTGDSLRLEQILTNLYNNAVKFTDHGSIVLTATQVPSHTAGRIRLRFSLRDTGIGISEDQMKELFRPFQQGDTSRSRRYGGTGLGLAISKRLVQLMGGEIGVNSELGKGSEFFFTAEFGMAAGASLQSAGPTFKPRPRAAAPAEISSAHILLVEDNELNRQVALELLADFGVQQVTTASNGAEALEKLQRGIFDLVLLDIQMPVMNGYEVARHIRRMPEFAKLPIIAMTASAMTQDRESAFASGMTDFISKPFAPAELFNVIAARLPIKNDFSEELGLRYCNGNSDLYLSILKRFVAATPGVTEKIHAKISAGDIQGAAQDVHFFISTAAMSGAKGLSDLSKELEQALREGEHELAQELLQRFERCLTSAADSARDILARTSGGETAQAEI